jgi:hypothetical protein
VSFLSFSKVSYISSMPILVPFLTLFSTSVRCNKAFSKLITKVMFIWPLCWYSRSHDCRILYVIGTPDHMTAGYYMLLVLQITWLQDIICYWYSRSHDCRILYVIGTPDHMIVWYYMLFWIFTGIQIHIPCLFSISPEPSDEGDIANRQGMWTCIPSEAQITIIFYWSVPIKVTLEKLLTNCDSFLDDKFW